MEREFLIRVARLWWVILLFPVGVGLWLLLSPPTSWYESTVVAVVLLPGDTDDPGSSERPELMIMDDVPALFSSEAAAEVIATKIDDADLGVADVQSSVSASRYSRIVTIRVSSRDQQRSGQIATAVEQSVSEIVNRFLIIPGQPAATVEIIDSASTPELNEVRWYGQIVLRLGAAVVVGLGAATLAVAVRDERRRPEERGD